MTLEQAINHCLEVAGSCETACELQHKQLANWLKELRELPTPKKRERVSITCDLCGAEITDYKTDLYRHTGVINGKFDDHIHLCKKCEDEVKPPLFNFDTRTIMESGNDSL
jgi:hypothetical protein